MLDLKADEQEIVRQILREYVPDREVWAFGSRVNGKAKPYSDLDLVVLGDEPLALDVRAGLNFAFDESDLPMRVDVVDWAVASEEFRKIILREFEVVNSV